MNVFIAHAQIERLQMSKPESSTPHSPVAPPLCCSQSLQREPRLHCPQRALLQPQLPSTSHQLATVRAPWHWMGLRRAPKSSCRRYSPMPAHLAAASVLKSLDASLSSAEQHTALTLIVHCLAGLGCEFNFALDHRMRHIQYPWNYPYTFELGSEGRLTQVAGMQHDDSGMTHRIKDETWAGSAESIRAGTYAHSHLRS